MMNKIKHTIELILKAFTESNFKVFIKELLTLQKELIKVDPEHMEPRLVDFGMDEDMWNDWVISSIDKDPTQYDWEAAGYIAKDLQEILQILN